jgi:hypothetical protein
MQGDPFDLQATASPGELGRPMGLAHLFQFGKKRSHLRQRPQDVFQLLTEADN